MFSDQFWRGTIGEAEDAFLTHQPKGEITVLIEGMTVIEEDALSESQLENELAELISNGHSLSTVCEVLIIVSRDLISLSKTVGVAIEVLLTSSS